MKLLSIRKSIKPLLRSHLENNRTANSTHKKATPFEVKGSQFAHQQLQEQANSSNSQLSNYSSTNRRLKTTQTLRNNSNKDQSYNNKNRSEHNLADGVFMRRKHSLAENFNTTVVTDSNIFSMMPKSSYQLSRIKTKAPNSNTLIKPQTSDFDKATFDSVEITNQLSNRENQDLIEENNNNNNVTNSNHNTDLSRNISNRDISLRQDLIFQNVFLTGNRNDSKNNSSNKIHEEGLTENTSINFEPQAFTGIRTNNLEFNPNSSNISEEAIKKKNSNSRIKVNFDKKLLNTKSPDVSNLEVLPVSIGMQPIYVNQQKQEIVNTD